MYNKQFIFFLLVVVSIHSIVYPFGFLHLSSPRLKSFSSYFYYHLPHFSIFPYFIPLQFTIFPNSTSFPPHVSQQNKFYFTTTLFPPLHLPAIRFLLAVPVLQSSSRSRHILSAISRPWFHTVSLILPLPYR